VKELEEQMRQRVAEGEKQLEEFKKLSLEKDAEEAAAAATDGDQKPAAGGDIKKKKNQKPKTSSKKKGKGKK
jgi:hypothetical protein